MEVVCRIRLGIIVSAVFVCIDQAQGHMGSFHRGEYAHARRVAKWKYQQHVDILLAEERTSLARLVSRIDQLRCNDLANLCQVFYQAIIHVDATFPEPRKLLPIVEVAGGKQANSGLRHAGLEVKTFCHGNCG